MLKKLSLELSKTKSDSEKDSDRNIKDTEQITCSEMSDNVETVCYCAKLCCYFIYVHERETVNYSKNTWHGWNKGEDGIVDE